MRHYSFSTFIVLFSISIFFQNCSNPDHSNKEKSHYILEIETIRNRKDLEFKNQKESPIPINEREGFTGLNYFVINENWKVKAQVIVNSETKDIEMAHTDGEIGHMMNVADLVFSWNGLEYRIHTFVNSNNPNTKSVFIPFYDDSNGNTTYSGGRYLDLSLSPTQDSVWVDFNLAYNPYCAYNDLFACPIPPESNYLKINIEAGEKM